MIQYQLLRKSAYPLVKPRAGDVGYDLRWDGWREDEKKFGVFYLLEAGERYYFDLGVAITPPRGYFAEIKARSGLANKFGVQVLGGIIDPGYIGALGVMLYNSGKEDLRIGVGDKIAQAVFYQYTTCTLQSAILQPTERGTDGFGSTGR